jgi:RNA polymerase sigma factor (TIGR02999 family)
VTRLLERARQGDRDALDRLVPLVYGELRRGASRSLRRDRAHLTWQTTALVHEAYLRLFGGTVPTFANRAHFLAIAARSMRQILVERARARGAAKRGGGRARTTLHDATLASEPREIDLLALDFALERLTALDARQASVVELRFFGGLTVEETAEAMGLSAATIKREWTVARAWLYRELTAGRESGGAARRARPEADGTESSG